MGVRKLWEFCIQQRGDGANSLPSFYWVSLKDKWDESFPRFGVILKCLEVKPKKNKEELINYKKSIKTIK